MYRKDTIQWVYGTFGKHVRTASHYAMFWSQPHNNKAPGNCKGRNIILLYFLPNDLQFRLMYAIVVSNVPDDYEKMTNHRVTFILRKKKRSVFRLS
jgi:hypothetical protein